MDYPTETHPEYRRRVYAYLGPPRSGIHQRAFAAPPDAIRWTEDDQITAIERGYFLERHDGGVNRVTLLQVGPRGFKHDQDIINALEQGRFYHDPHATKALAFIKQQDQYGFSGAWQPRPRPITKRSHVRPDVRTLNVVHDRYTPQLLWYKKRMAAERAMHPAARAKLVNARKYGGTLVPDYVAPEPELPTYKEHGLKGKPWSAKRRAAHVLNNPNQT